MILYILYIIYKRKNEFNILINKKAFLLLFIAKLISLGNKKNLASIDIIFMFVLNMKIFYNKKEKKNIQI